MGLAALAVVLLAGLAQPAVIFTLDPPGGAISGAPGTTVGWGYAISITDANFLTVDFFQFQEDNPVGVFPASGFAPRWQAASPGNPLIVPFDVLLGDGIGYRVGAAPAGTSTQGPMWAYYTLWDIDPVANPDTAQIVDTNLRIDATNEAGAQVQASVTVLEGTPIPEPATWTLFACAAAAIALLRRATA